MLSKQNKNEKFENADIKIINKTNRKNNIYIFLIIYL